MSFTWEKDHHKIRRHIRWQAMKKYGVDFADLEDVVQDVLLELVSRDALSRVKVLSGLNIYIQKVIVNRFKAAGMKKRQAKLCGLPADDMLQG